MRLEPRNFLALQSRCHLLLIKTQESALAFLFRWFLLDLPDSQAAGTAYSGARKPTRSDIILGDVAKKLPDRRPITIIKYVLWRWFTPVNVIELLLILFLAACCFLQCYELLGDYFKYPSYIRVSQVLNDDFRQDLPAVTLCNKNRLSRSMVKSNFPHLNQSHLIAIGQGTFVSSDNFTYVAKEDAKLEEQTDWPKVMDYFLKGNVENYYKVTPNYSMLKTITCANAWGEHLPCAEFEQIQSIQRGLSCLTLFHDSVLWDKRFGPVKKLEAALESKPGKIKFYEESSKDPSGRSEVFNEQLATGSRKGLEEPNLSDPSKLVEMGNEEIVRLRFNFRSEDYLDERLATGALLNLHSNSVIGFMRHIVYNVTPGYWYNYYIQRFDYERLPEPYESRCFNYEQNRYVWQDRLGWLDNEHQHILELARQVAVLATNKSKEPAGGGDQQWQQQHQQHQQHQQQLSGEHEDWIEHEIAREYAGTLRNRSMSRVSIRSDGCKLRDLAAYQTRPSNGALSTGHDFHHGANQSALARRLLTLHLCICLVCIV